MNRNFLALAITLAATPTIAEEAESRKMDNDKLEEVTVLGSGATFNSSAVTEPMRQQQSTLTSVNALIDNLPGVSVNEGDTYGFDDWSTQISVRGFTTGLNEQQVGTTIDGVPNGGSNYGGGSKANRFVDPANIAGIEVSQGTADIATRSHEALGGTIDYRTADPEDIRRTRTEISLGEFDAQRLYLRHDTGLIAGNTKAWVSYSTQEATDWITETAENEREHIAAKFVSEFPAGNISGYIAYDDIHEDNYQRIYADAQFEQFPETDFLTGEWTGIPYIDQLYRQGWSTLRKNLLAYAQFDFNLTDTLNLQGGVYRHNNEGRGDWVPPYLVDVTNDGEQGNSEYFGGSTAKTSRSNGLLYFVDSDGNALTPAEGCTSNIVTIYGQASAQFDPGCYPAGAIPVMSYRHTHYEKERTGFTVDFTHENQIAGLDNQLRGGFWYEDATRDEYRDWHNILDTSRGAGFDPTPYWIQYDRSYPQVTSKWYLQDALTVDTFTLSLGVKQFLVEVEREDRFFETPNANIDSDSDLLISAGLVWQTPLEGMEVFTGYAENFKAIGDIILERPESDLDNIEPETSETIELGLRYQGSALAATATYFSNEFDNRIIFLDSNTSAGPSYLIGTNGSYFNAGGIESEGIELLFDYDFSENLNAYASFTLTDATYIGTGDTAVDAAQGLVPGNEVIGVADQLLVLGIDWRADWLYAGLSAKVTGDRFVDLANTWTAESYTVADAYLGVNVFQGSGPISNVNLNLVVNNLLDEDYLGSVVANGAWIGAPRTTSLSATIDF